MDADRFAALLAALSLAPSRRSALRLLSGLGLAGILGHDQSQAKHKRKHHQHKKVTLCPNGQTLLVPRSAVKALLSQGATRGVCPPPPPPPPPALPPPPPCQGQADGTACGSGQQCSGEVCATPPSCSTSYHG